MARVVIVAVLAVFLSGVLFGVIAAAAMAARREDGRYSLAGEVPDWLSRSTRRLIGLGRRDAHFPPGGPLSD